MSVFDYNASGAGDNFWNYSKQDKEGYSTSLTGTVVEIYTPQKTKYEPNGGVGNGALEFWPNGEPRLNIGFIIQGQSGRELTWVFSPKSAAADACKAALPQAQSLVEFLGKQITVETVAAPQGFGYGAQNPRPWRVIVHGEGNPQIVRKAHEELRPITQATQQVPQQPSPFAVQQPFPQQQQFAPQPQQFAQPQIPPAPQVIYSETDVPF